MSTTNFKKTYPIDFELLNDQDQSSLFITDNSSGQKVQLKIVNSSDEDMEINQTTADASSYNFYLKFRAGILIDKIVDNSLPLISSSSKWQISPATTTPSGEVVFYFGAKANITFQKEELLSISLDNLTPDGTHGTRTTRLELGTDNIVYTGTENNIKSVRLSHLSLINHRGKSHIPLHLGVIGVDTVVNDGKPNDIAIRVFNNSHPNEVEKEIDKIIFKHSTIDSDRSKIFISVDTGPIAQGWALTTTEEASAIDLVGILGWHIEGHIMGTDAGHLLYPDTGDVELDGRQFFDIRLTGIRTLHASGISYINFHYENIPGYMDGVMRVPVQKGPIVILPEKVEIHDDVQIDKGLVVDETLKIRGSLHADCNTEITGELTQYGGEVMPIGGIIMWSGATNNIPTGWKLCDGNHDTPDLRNRFVVGAGANYAVKNTGGSDHVAITTGQMPLHHHHGSTGSAGSHTHAYLDSYRNMEEVNGSNFNNQGVKSSLGGQWRNTHAGGSHSHTFSTSSVGSSQAHENRPPYYALCFIMRVRN